MSENTPDYDTEDQFYIICPYCGQEYDDEFDPDSAGLYGIHLDCHNCGKEFRLAVDRTVLFSTYKK